MRLKNNSNIAYKHFSDNNNSESLNFEFDMEKVIFRER